MCELLSFKALCSGNPASSWPDPECLMDFEDATVVPPEGDNDNEVSMVVSALHDQLGILVGLHGEVEVGIPGGDPNVAWC